MKNAMRLLKGGYITQKEVTDTSDLKRMFHKRCAIDKLFRKVMMVPKTWKAHV
jgi:hypothetical protein